MIPTIIPAPVLTASSAPQERYFYSAYGSPVFLNATMSAVLPASAYDSTYLFTAQAFNRISGLHLFRKRFLDPISGRFVTRDPLMYVSGANLYASHFVPRGTDVFGLKPFFEGYGWTCASALARIEQLRNDWNTLGYGFSVELLDAFLAKSGSMDNNPATIIHISNEAYCKSVTQSSTFLWALGGYVETKLRNRLCSRQSSSIAAANAKAFSVSFLSNFWLALDVMWNQRSDWYQDHEYAIGDAEIWQNGLTVTRVSRTSCGCKYRVSGDITVNDAFHFNDGTGFRSGSTEYAAGTFLQDNCGYHGFRWDLTCSIDAALSYSEC